MTEYTKGIDNLIHGADSEEASAREIKLWFGESRILVSNEPFLSWREQFHHLSESNLTYKIPMLLRVINGSLGSHAMESTLEEGR